MIANEGLAEARDVRIEPVAALDDLRMIDLRLDAEPLVLGPGDERSFLAIVAMGSSRGAEFRLSWVDDGGHHLERLQVHRPGV